MLLATKWQARLDQTPIDDSFYLLLLDALNELNQQWQYYDQKVLYVGRLIRPEFDEDGDETGELIDVSHDDDAEDERVTSVIEAISRGIGIHDSGDGVAPRLVHIAAYNPQFRDEPFREINIAYKLKASIVDTQFYAINSEARGYIKRGDSDISIAARAFHEEFLKMVSSKSFYTYSAEEQSKMVEYFLSATNEHLYDPNVPLYTTCETSKYLTRESVETPYGFRTVTSKQPMAIEGWHQGFSWLERDVIHTKAITSRSQMIDARGGLCAMILPFEIDGELSESDQTIFVPLTYAKEFHTAFPDEDDEQMAA